MNAKAVIFGATAVLLIGVLLFSGTQRTKSGSMHLSDEDRAYFEEYQSLNAELASYHDGLAEMNLRSEPERVFADLGYFWNAAIINSNDIFGYMWFMTEHKADFEAIGAIGCLRSMDELDSFFREQSLLETRDEQNKYWHRTRDARADAESHAEGTLDFGKLLLQYAKKNLPPQ